MKQTPDCIYGEGKLVLMRSALTCIVIIVKNLKRLSEEVNGLLCIAFIGNEGKKPEIW